MAWVSCNRCGGAHVIFLRIASQQFAAPDETDASTATENPRISFASRSDKFARFAVAPTGAQPLACLHF
jgi:hypothetical protein